MTAEELVVRVFDALTALGASFLVSGSLASNFYGVPRATQDADLVLDLARLPLDGLAQHLAADFDIDGQVGFETVTGSSRLVLHARESPFEVELFGLTDDPHDLARFARRRFVEVLGRTVALPTPEDVVINKLRWFREARRSKDFEDARNVLAVQRASLDWPYLEHWCQRMALAAMLREADTL